jgi:hypothetical protein
VSPELATGLGVVVLLALAMAVLLAMAMRHHAHERRALIQHLRDAHDAVVASIHEADRRVERERERCEQRVDAARTQTFDALRSMHTDHVEAMARLLSVQTMGTPTPTPGEVVSEPSPEERATNAAQEATIQKGIGNLREMYKDLGIARSDDELRAEAIDMLGGRSPEPPADLAAWLRG